MTKKQINKLDELQVRAKNECLKPHFINLSEKYGTDTLLCGGNDEYYIKSVNLDEKTICVGSKFTDKETLNDISIASFSSDNIETIIDWAEYYIEGEETSTAKVFEHMADANI